jgi:hypothetical protein
MTTWNTTSDGISITISQSLVLRRMPILRRQALHLSGGHELSTFGVEQEDG